MIGPAHGVLGASEPDKLLRVHIEMHCASTSGTDRSVVQFMPLMSGYELPAAGDALDPLLPVLRTAVPVERFGAAHGTFELCRFRHGDRNPSFNGKNILSVCYRHIKGMLRLC